MLKVRTKCVTLFKTCDLESKKKSSCDNLNHLKRLKVAVKESIDMKDQHHRQQDKTIQMLVEKVASLSAKLIALGSFAMSKKSTN